MAAPQLSDPGTSSEWFPTVEETARSNATVRRQRFQRLVTYTMVGLTAFAVLGVVSFAVRRHSQKAALATPPPAPLVQPAAAAAPLVARAPETVSPPAPPVSDAPVAAAAAPPQPVAKAKPAIKKAPSRSPFLKSAKPQPASIKRR
jgi:hypothetical protein